MTPLDATLAELEDLERRATPGPWRASTCVRGDDGRFADLVVADGHTGNLGQFCCTHDANIAVAARNALPAILEDRARLVKERDEARAETAALSVAAMDADLYCWGAGFSTQADAAQRSALLRKLCQPGPDRAQAGWRLLDELRAAEAARDTAIADIAKARDAIHAARVASASVHTVQGTSACGNADAFVALARALRALDGES